MLVYLAFLTGSLHVKNWKITEINNTKYRQIYANHNYIVPDIQNHNHNNYHKSLPFLDDLFLKVCNDN